MIYPVHSAIHLLNNLSLESWKFFSWHCLHVVVVLLCGTAVLCSSRKYPCPPQGRLTEIPRGREFQKPKYDTKMEFLEGWGGFQTENPPIRGVWIFSGTTHFWWTTDNYLVSQWEICFATNPVHLRLMVLFEDSKLHSDVLLASWRWLSVVLFVDVILISGDITNHLLVYQWILDWTIGSRFLPHNKCFLLRWLALFSVTGISCVDHLVVSTCINDEGILVMIAGYLGPHTSTSFF